MSFFYYQVSHENITNVDADTTVALFCLVTAVLCWAAFCSLSSRKIKKK